MELPAGLNRRYASFAGFLLVMVWIWVAFDRPYIFPDHVAWNIYANSPQSPNTDVFDYPPRASAAIKKVCANAQFNESIIFTCDNSRGNVADVRNSILHCVRYAIAGGGTLLLPKIAAKEGAGSKTEYTYEMDHMFDTRHFVTSLRLNCPQLQVKSAIDEEASKMAAQAPIPLNPESIAAKDEDGQILPLEWKASLYKWLAQYHSPDAEGPVLVQLARSYLQYPIGTDEPAFVQDFGKILKIREDARILATTALIKLAAEYAPNMLIKDPIIHKAFLGAYVSVQDQGKGTTDTERVEARFKAQAKLYLRKATQSNFTTIYVASDDSSLIPRLVSEANGTGIAITTKFDLVKGEDRKDLLAMRPDQQLLVDYLVFSKASDFSGVGYSSLAWNVALWRRQFSEQEENWLNIDESLLSDELSQIYGPPGGHPEYVASMWP